MHLEGSHILDAPLEKVWEMLLDPDVLAKATPGVKELVPLGDDKYKAISQIRIGAVNGLFDGQMQVSDKVAPESFTLAMTMQGKIGHVEAVGKLSLKAVNDQQTEVVFAGDAKLGGKLARTGQRLLNSVAKTLTKQFFKSLAKTID